MIGSITRGYVDETSLGLTAREPQSLTFRSNGCVLRFQIIEFTGELSCHTDQLFQLFFVLALHRCCLRGPFLTLAVHSSAAAIFELRRLDAGKYRKYFCQQRWARLFRCSRT